MLTQLVPWKWPLALAVFILVLAGHNSALLADSIDLSTGLDNSNNLITSGGTADAHWSVRSYGGSPAAAEVVASGNPDWFSGWLPNGPSSSWIARNAFVPDNWPNGALYSVSFDLSGYDLSTVSMSGGWALDEVDNSDFGTLALNGHSIEGLGVGAWTSLTGFSVGKGSSFFNQGLNTLTISLTYQVDVIVATRLQGSVSGSLATTAAPLPQSAAGGCALLGFLAILTFIRRRSTARPKQ
jgi:hypothetical protein